MGQPLHSVPITRTTEGASTREIATEVIADKLGIRKEDVTPETDLGDKWRDIAMVMAMKTGAVIVSNGGMKAEDIFVQL